MRYFYLERLSAQNHAAESKDEIEEKKKRCSLLMSMVMLLIVVYHHITSKGRAVTLVQLGRRAALATVSNHAKSDQMQTLKQRIVSMKNLCTTMGQHIPRRVHLTILWLFHLFYIFSGI